MAAMMLSFVQDQSHNVKVIIHNFLESGHTMMEVYSMQAAIETKKKKIN